ncbi:MAG TPA: hypothetical protein VF782_13475 [Allosphingosinicella sp.]|jgi:hypothetical protein
MRAALDASKELDQLLALYFQLLDLSLDVERNKEDFAFSSLEGAKISYVFDENVLELFIQPKDGRGRMTSLHASHWSRAPSATRWARPYVCQTTLATAEYLLSGELPAQHRRTIFMTEWHRWEFTKRVEMLQSLQVDRLRRAGRKAMRQRFAGARELLRLAEKDPDGVEDRVEDRRLAADLAAYRARDPEPHALETYLATRLSLAILAEDQLMEPAEQLRRLVTSPLRNSFSTLHRSLPPVSTEEKQVIANDTRDWVKRLRDHCERRGIEVRRSDEADATEGPYRTEGAIWDDAKSMALVRWAAAQKARTSLNERLVFVTADQIVFDAYREWYAELSFSDPAYSEPFCFRRLTQYTPVFNFVSSGRAEGEAYVELFKDLLQALEVMLLPLNLSRVASRAPQIVLGRMREKTALRPTEPGRIAEDPAYQPLVSALRQGGLSAHRSRLDDIIDRWRELERAALGRADEPIQRRIQAAEALDAALDLDVSMDAYERYVKELVQALLLSSRTLSVPLAREFIDEEWPAHARGELSRAPIALQLIVNTPTRTISIGETLDRLLAGEAGPLLDEDAWKALDRQPALVFSLAAARCLAVRDWGNAQRFAEMALVEEMEDSENLDARGRQDRRREIKYLYALVTRFRIGEIGPPLTGEAFGRICRFYRSALGHLDECETYHGDPDHRQELRLMRTLSERAALHLFYVSTTNERVRAAAAGRRARTHRGPRRDLRELLPLDARASAVAALERAESDLAACLALDRQIGPIDDPQRNAFRMKLQRQYYTNIATAGVFRALWDEPLEGAPPQLRPDSPAATRRAREVLARYGGAAHPLMRADIFAFLTLGGDPDAAEDLKAEPPLAPRPGMLNLDVAIVEALRISAAYLLEAGVRAAAAPVEAL